MPVFKQCIRCKEEKRLGEFYFQKNGSMGRTGACKECRKKKQKEYQKTNRAKLLKSEWEKNNREGAKERHKKFKEKNPDYWKLYYKQNREIRLKNHADWRKRNPERVKFYHKFYRAVKEGKIEKSKVCQMCGKHAKTEGHHFDYTNISNMIWVCRPCHSLIHKTKREK